VRSGLAAFAFAAFAFASAENTISLLEGLRQASTTSVGQLQYEKEKYGRCKTTLTE